MHLENLAQLQVITSYLVSLFLLASLRRLRVALGVRRALAASLPRLANFLLARRHVLRSRRRRPRRHHLSPDAVPDRPLRARDLARPSLAVSASVSPPRILVAVIHAPVRHHHPQPSLQRQPTPDERQIQRIPIHHILRHDVSQRAPLYLRRREHAHVRRLGLRRRRLPRRLFPRHRQRERLLSHARVRRAHFHPSPTQPTTSTLLDHLPRRFIPHRHVVTASFTSRRFPADAQEFAHEVPDLSLTGVVQKQTVIVRCTSTSSVGHARDRARDDE